MKTKQKSEAARRMDAATEQAQVFLLPAYLTKRERTDAVLTAAGLVRQAIEYAVRGGRDDLGHKLLNLALSIEARAC